MTGPVDPADFAAAFAALYAAHQVADHWVQTQRQADRKGLPGWAGRIACAAHVASYTLTAAVALTLVAAATGWRPNLLAVAAGLAVSAVSHYVADRRTPLRRLADLLGKDPAWLERGGGLYALDQSWHVGWLFVAALIVAV
ncbi:transcriptional regulator [Nakamurella sp.]|uniref:transcriptional regulator n=1 Tax=Nakamurella sp. TaxID=1869182 RepID=UPI003B3A3E4D